MKVGDLVRIHSTSGNVMGCGILLRHHGDDWWILLDNRGQDIHWSKELLEVISESR
jgi:hypothetical protein